MTDTERYEYTIYKICSNECGEFYIGSTRNMVQRKKLHKSVCNNPNNKGYNTKIYRTIRDNDGWENWRMVPLEKMENTTKFEAECREEVVRCELQAKMNSYRATRGNVSVQEYRKIYNEENIDHIRENKKRYYEEKIDYFKEYNKKYREEKMEQIKLQKNQKNDCECGGRYIQCHKARHFKSQLHQKYLNSLEVAT